MNKRGYVFGVSAILFIAVCILTGCEQLTEPGSNSSGRETPFELDSPLLIEVWDSSTPPRFLGYDTGLGDWYGEGLVLTSKGYCVSLWRVRYSNSEGYKRSYGEVADRDQGNVDPELEMIIKNTGWGYAVFFDTASNPTANDTPYALWSSNIVNSVMFNPHNGGTYYTWDTNAARRDITIRADHKFYDNTGTIRTWDDGYFSEYYYLVGGGSPPSAHIGETLGFQPLKRIGGYAELGLPDPQDVTSPLIYKVKY